MRQKIGFFLILGTVAFFQLTLLANNTVSKTQRFPILENEEVKIWRTVIAPNQPLAFHRHENRRIIIPLNDMQLKKIFKDSDKTETLNWAFRQAYWYGPDPKDELHGDVNDTKKDMEVIVIEFQKQNCK